MGFRGLFEGWHIVILLLVVVVVFGWKRLPDASRSLGRSMRIFKAEVSEMKTDGKPAPSPASTETVRGNVVPPVYETYDTPGAQSTFNPSAQPTMQDSSVPHASTTPAAAPHDHQQPA